MTSTTPVKIGFLFSKSGVTAEMERSQWQGATLALEEINQQGGLDGRELVAIEGDPRSDPMQFRLLAEQLIRAEGVNVIVGGYTSSTRKAMLPVVEKYNKLLIYPQQYEGFEFSENIIYGGAAPNQNGAQLADFMSNKYGARVYMIGSSYIYPYECNRNMRELLLQNPDGVVLGERYLDLDANEGQFREVVDDIKQKQPDFIFSTVIGRTIPYLYRAYADAGLDPEHMPIGSLNTSEVELYMMGPQYGAGHYTASPYFQSIDAPENHRAVQSHRNRFGAEYPTNMNWEAAYYLVHMYGNAFRNTGSDEIGALLPRLKGAEILAPQGRIRIDPANHHMALHARLGRATTEGQFLILRESGLALPPDPYMTSQRLGGRSIKLAVLGE